MVNLDAIRRKVQPFRGTITTTGPFGIKQVVDFDMSDFSIIPTESLERIFRECERLRSLNDERFEALQMMSKSLVESLNKIIELEKLKD